MSRSGDIHDDKDRDRRWQTKPTALPLAVHACMG